jgi:hypothetical protein
MSPPELLVTAAHVGDTRYLRVNLRHLIGEIHQSAVNDIIVDILATAVDSSHFEIVDIVLSDIEYVDPVIKYAILYDNDDVLEMVINKVKRSTQISRRGRWVERWTGTSTARRYGVILSPVRNLTQLIIMAIESGKLSTVKKIVDNFWEDHMSYSNNEIKLIYNAAIKSGDNEIDEYLRQRGVYPDNNLLVAAINTGDRELAMELIGTGMKIPGEALNAAIMRETRNLPGS